METRPGARGQIPASLAQLMPSTAWAEQQVLRNTGLQKCPRPTASGLHPEAEALEQTNVSSWELFLDFGEGVSDTQKGGPEMG